MFGSLVLAAWRRYGLLDDGVRLVAVMPYNSGFLPVVLNRLQTSTA